MRLLRRLGANARYFTDQSTKIPLDVASGDAAVGMCIDYYGRFQAEAAAAAGRPGQRRLRHRARRDVDQPRSRSRSCAGRRTASWRSRSSSSCSRTRARSCGASGAARPGGPERYTLRRLPIVPHLYDHAFDAYRADPDDNPYEEARDFVYHRAWTGPLYSALAFVVRVMCVDPERELQDAYDALARAGFPPRGDGAVRRRLGGRLRDGRGAAAGGAAVGGSDGRGALVDPPRERIPRAVPARDGAGAGGPDDRSGARATRSPIVAVAVVGALLAALLLWPLAEGVRGAFVDGHGRLTFAYVATVFRNPIYLEGLRNALAIAVVQHRHRRRASASAPRCCSTASTFPAGGCWPRWCRCR